MALLENLNPTDQFDVVETKIDAAITTVNDVLAAGAIGEVIRKKSGTDFDVEWSYMAKQKIIQIGTWNMVTTPILSINHGLDYTKIIGYRVLIQNDGGNLKHTIDYYTAYGSLVPSGGVSSTSNQIGMYRTALGAFDGPDYNNPNVNRGWIIIDYID